MKQMKSKVMMILGGYGNAGISIARLLLQETDLNLVLAGRNTIQAKNAANELNTQFGGARVQGMRVDATNVEDLRKAFTHCDTVVVCVPVTGSGIRGGVVQAAFDAGINYIDINLDEEKQQLLRHLSEQMKRSGRYFMTEAGLVPGLPSAMAFFAAKYFDRLHSLRFGFVERENSGGYGSAIDLMYYTANPAFVYEKGAWRKVSATTSKKIGFGHELGNVTCYPMDLYELRTVPEELGVDEIGFYAAGMNPVTDLVLLFWSLSRLYKFAWSLRLGAKLGIWTVQKFTKPPFTTTLSMKAEGEVDGHAEIVDMMISHENGYQATAIPAVAGILQLLDGSLTGPGVMIMGHCVNPDRFFGDIKRLGMNVRIRRFQENNAPISSFTGTGKT